MELAEFTAWQTSTERVWSDEAFDSAEPHWAESLWGNSGDGPWGAIGLIECAGADAYDDTPAHAEVFFRSGVDGVHWSAMAAAVASGQVVVMTVPGALQPNLILGESLEEFLALGCQLGFWNLAALGHDLKPDRIKPQEATALRILTEMAQGLSLEPWPDIPARLAELTRVHGRPRPRYVPPGRPLDPALLAIGPAVDRQIAAMADQIPVGGDPDPEFQAAFEAAKRSSDVASAEWSRLRNEWRRDQAGSREND
jgi:hypothetical protein